MTKEEKCRDEKLDLGVSKFMGNLGFTRRKLMGNISLDYVRNRQEIKQNGFVLQALHESLRKIHNEGKRQRGSKKDLVGK